MSSVNFLSITDQVAGHLRAEILRGRWTGTIPGSTSSPPPACPGDPQEFRRHVRYPGDDATRAEAIRTAVRAQLSLSG